MNLYENRTEIQRISLSKDENYKEPWVINIPVDISTFRYDTEKRKKQSVAPVFEADKKIEVIEWEVGGGIVNQIKFKQAVQSDLVHSYRIILDNGTESKELLYFSDFFLMKEDRREYIILKLPNTVLSGKYTVTIYAIESFGKESEPLVGEITIR